MFRRFALFFNLQRYAGGIPKPFVPLCGEAYVPYYHPTALGCLTTTTGAYYRGGRAILQHLLRQGGSQAWNPHGDERHFSRNICFHEEPHVNNSVVRLNITIYPFKYDHGIDRFASRSMLLICIRAVHRMPDASRWLT